MEAHHETAPELWMGLYKKHVPDRGLTWADAVPEALCFGWIDSVAQRIDADAVRQRWTPRRTGSVWSSINISHVERLRAAGLMHPAGLAAYERRRPDRSGIYAYETAEAELDPARLARLQEEPSAWAFWRAATPSYRKGCTSWVMTAKQEATRDKRLASLSRTAPPGGSSPPSGTEHSRGGWNGPPTRRAPRGRSGSRRKAVAPRSRAVVLLAARPVPR